jgi:hypothetical protein
MSETERLAALMTLHTHQSLSFITIHPAIAKSSAFFMSVPEFIPLQTVFFWTSKLSTVEPSFDSLTFYAITANLG